MAITEYNYIPEYTRLGVNNKPKDVITASYWNGLFNALSHQGDHTAEELGNVLNHFSTILAGVENEIAESAEAIANVRGALRINVTYSNGVYSADKTFDEIKAAYDAGQYPYVVSHGGTVYMLSDCFLSTPQMCMDFTRHLIGENTLKTEKLRIYSYTTANGSNIERLDGEFNIPIDVLEVALTTQNGVTVADKTFAQVETAVESGIPVLKVHSDGEISWFFLLDKSPTEIDFVGLADEQIIAYLTAKQDGTWETTVAARVTAEMLSSLNDKVGNIGQLTTTDKTNLVAAVNEVKQAADSKQDKLIAGDNITIAADGKTISAIGGSSASIAMRVNSGYIQYSTDNGATWSNLIAEADLKGAAGKSAYAYSVDGGYTGTETEFAEKLAQEPLIGTTNELTPTQVYNAVSAGIPVKVRYFDNTFGILAYTNFSVAESMNLIGANTISYVAGAYILGELIGTTDTNKWSFLSTILAQKSDIPSALPNPDALTFTGAVNATYDGSAPLNVKIPSAVTDAHINSLIDTKLGVIENGSY